MAEDEFLCPVIDVRANARRRVRDRLERLVLASDVLPSRLGGGQRPLQLPLECHSPPRNETRPPRRAAPTKARYISRPSPAIGGGQRLLEVKQPVQLAGVD